ncbi:transcriptional activator DEMETER [Euphorbia lathyris]|uniref:transcriptional activator DEMETER n=1 Tax=Euphorbia lathyris TaxID=212925 RepID=UPI003313377B
MDLNSSMSSGDKESNFVDFWMPITPEKTMTATSDHTLMLMDGHGSQFLGREPDGFPNPNDNRMEQQFSKINEWDGQFLSLLTNDTTSNTSVSMAERPINPYLCSWEPTSVELSLANQTHCSNSNMLSSSNVLQGVPQYGFPRYDLNLTPSIETSVATTVTDSFQFAPLTPSEKCANEREKQQHDIFISMDNVANVHNCNVLSENTVDTSSVILSVPSEEPKDAVVSTSTEEPKISGRLSDQIIDLNETPQQKTPKRKKHRPKVIKEGKSERTPKAANMTTADPEKKASEKKAVPSCKKALNFDLENATGTRENNSVTKQKLLNKETETSKLSTGFEVTEPIITIDIISRTESSLHMSQQNELMLEKSEAMTNLARSMNLMQANALLSGRKEAGISYISVSNRTVGDLNPSARDTNIRNQQFIPGQGISQIGIPEKHNCISSDRTGQMVFHFNPQSVTLVPPYLDESRRSKREYCQVAKKIHGINNEVCSETPKKMRIENVIKTNIDGILPSVAALDHSWASRNNVNSVESASQPGDTMQPAHRNTKVSMEQAIVPVQCQTLPSRECKMAQSKMRVFNNGQLPGKRKGPAKQKFPVTVEDITYQMESLNLSETKGNEKNALVPYKGDHTLIPHEGFQFIKKPKTRPKVDLDAETERVWKFLMRKEGIEDQDEEKKQWWEEERTDLHRRVTSFIEIMRDVQGDRRFSKWKGSVVDSVIGVFLTQNVSDHLSSSAFMSLAATFPIKPTIDRTCQRDGTIVQVEEPDLCLQNLNEKMQEKLLRHPFYDHSSMTLHGLEEHQLESEASCTETTGRLKGYSHSPEEVLSSQDSLDSLVINGVRSYSSSNSEAEEPANGYKCNNNHNSGSVDLQAESITSFAEFYSNINGRSLFPEESRHEHRQPEDIEYGQQQIRSERPECSHKLSSTYNQQTSYSNLLMQIPTVPSSNYQFMTSHAGVLEVESLDFHREESISSWPSSREKDASCTGQNLVQGAENVARTMTTQYGSARCQESPPVGSYGKQLTCEQGNAHPHHRLQPHEMKILNLESQSTSELVNLADVQTNRKLVSNIPDLRGKLFNGESRIDLVANQQTPIEIKLVESNSNDQVRNKINLNVNSIKERKGKGKANSDKKDTVDWDSLRKQVQPNGERKEKRKDAMDSLDYEAMRKANVNKISTAIRERGMNHMLAKRMKEFLDRLVSDHDSIDLEWLKDVPPEKAKEYLLSVWGLGLKSVECVRLLTLHHVAFPVDTNVGRIAVRLGWVPLQPLPESLQLHNLELYPTLESVQKYLWPRLCNLDQQTLYELHYQMITFGKVFCTKSRPNCNECPLRAGCRHFASASASARLALPGPGEKNIVAHTVPLTTGRGPGIIIDPMPLPPPEDNKLQRVGPEIVSCVPIIEEPSTPEQEQTEATESDMEDLFDDETEATESDMEDLFKDETPTIIRKMEDFSKNLQNYAERNMDIQEFDMSKALVALNTEAASIPTPKLKNISRLRTEHLVYELPDSHPLLNGMDKREPDDPSPYLLAIWTPGETAESIFPPGRHCNSLTVRGTLLIPCRTAMRGRFPLNGTYFQINEMFADHTSSLNPIDVPRELIWNLSRRMVYFGTSVSSIFKGLSKVVTRNCFRTGFVCVRGFDIESRAPRPLQARLHFAASKLAKTKTKTKNMP